MKFDAKAVLDRIKIDIREKLNGSARPPKVLIITTGYDEPSERYVRNKCRDFDEVGIKYKVKNVTTIGKLLKVIDAANNDTHIDGIIVQRPIILDDPIGISDQHRLEQGVASWIYPKKDIDGARKDSPYPTACVRALDILLAETNYTVCGKHALVIGRGEVGMPVARRLLDLDASVTVAHSKTPAYDLKCLIRMSDIVIGAAGVKTPIEVLSIGFVPSLIVDYGITKDDQGNLHGDLYVTYPENPYMTYTAVPGGMGLLVRAALLMNIMDAYDKRF